MTVLEVDLSFLFVIAVILIWFMIAYQFVLTVYGFINYVRSMKERNDVDGPDIRFSDMRNSHSRPQRRESDRSNDRIDAGDELSER